MENNRIFTSAKEWPKLIIFLNDLIKSENLRNSDVLRLLNLPMEEIYLKYIFEDQEQQKNNQIITELSNLKSRYNSHYSSIAGDIRKIKSSTLLFKEFYINHNNHLMDKYRNIINISLSKNNNKLIIYHTSRLNIKSLELYLKKLLVNDKFKKNKYRFKEIILLRN